MAAKGMAWYRGKRIFITGGSKGIGRALAVQLAAAGAHVLIAARGQAALDEAVAAMRAGVSEGGSPAQVIGSISLDVTDRPGIRAAIPQILAQLGGLDVLICGSGYALPGYVHQVSDESFDAMMSVNYMGHVNISRAFLPHFMAQGSGQICLVSSMMGFLPLFGYAAYTASKFAIVGYAEVLRMELERHGISVSVFYPPTTQTPGLDQENEQKPRAVWLLESESAFSKTFTAEKVAAAIAHFVPTGRFDAVTGGVNWLLYYFYRHMPGLARYITRSEIEKAVQKAAAE